MAEIRSLTRESGGEKLGRWGRNWNAFGAVAIGGIALAIPGPNVVLGTLAGINAAQAAGFELLRRTGAKKKSASQPT